MVLIVGVGKRVYGIRRLQQYVTVTPATVIAQNTSYFFFLDMLDNLSADQTTDHIYNIINELSKPNIFSLPEYFLLSSDTYIGFFIIFLLIILHPRAIYLRLQNAS